MIDLEKDRKSGTWIITKTDKEGFHRQLNVTTDDMKELLQQFCRIYFSEKR